MSQLRDGRRKDDFAFWLDVTPAIRPDKTRTEYFPPTSTQMKSVVRGEDRQHSLPDPKTGMLTVALVCFLAVAFGIFLFFGS